MERKGIPHHLLDCLALDQEPWTVGDFIAKASSVIEEIQSRGRVPILVGGTHYYTHSLLFKDTVLEPSEQRLTSEEMEAKWPILLGSGEEMLEELRKVDPQMAKRWHFKDDRRIRRSLEIWLEKGRKPSEIYEEQKVQKAPAPECGNLTLRDDYLDVENTTKQLQTSMQYSTLLFWIHADSDILKARLNERVDSMIQNGLLSEIESMHMSFINLVANGASIDRTRGIWVAVGYKEFEVYLTACRKDVKDTELNSLKSEAIERTKAATRRYARRQTRWIRLRLLPELRDNESLDKTFLLDGSDLSRFEANVEETACRIAETFLAGQKPEDNSAISEANRAVFNLASEIPTKTETCARLCDICGTTLMTERDVEQHLNGRKHKGLLKRAQREAGNDEVEHSASL